MKLTKNCRSKYHIKRILVPLLLAAIVATIILEMGVLLSWQKPSFDLASVDILKISAPDPLEPPQECLDKPDGYNKWVCLGPYFTRVTNEVSVRAAMAEARRFKEEKAVSDCHISAHLIGETSLEKHNFDIGKAFSSCTSGCNDGCFHGVMERYIRGEEDLSGIASKIKNVCDSLGNKQWYSGETFYRCVHGVGHGLRAHNYIPLRDAITACDAFGPEWRSVCIGGITMENVDQYLELDLDEDTLIKFIPQICDEIESLDGRILVEIDIIDLCLYNVALGLMDYTGFDVERTEELCEELPRQKYIDQCKKMIDVIVTVEEPSNIDIAKFIENRHFR